MAKTKQDRIDVELEEWKKFKKLEEEEIQDLLEIAQKILEGYNNVWFHRIMNVGGGSIMISNMNNEARITVTASSGKTISLERRGREEWQQKSRR